MNEWNASSVKAQLRLTSQRLGQLQEKKDAKAQITKRDIATLLQQGDVGLARAKAHNLIQEDAHGDLLEVLEMYVGLLLEHFSEIEHKSTPSPVIAEAASSIIFAAPHTESKDLMLVRDLLIQRLGPDFARSAMGNHDNYVPLRVIHALSAPPPSATHLNGFLSSIATANGVGWQPEPRRQDIINALSEILDPDTSPIVDLPRLRHLSTYGLPDEPAWLRPRIWKLFLGILPVVKSSWPKELAKHRESYYDLLRRLLPPFETLPPPTNPLGPLDKSLLDASNQLSGVAPGIFAGLEAAPEPCDLCPVDPSAQSQIRIACAATLDARLKTLKGDQSEQTLVTPEIRLESEDSDLQEEQSPTAFAIKRERSITETLVPSHPFNAGNAHPRHLSALLRLIFLHFSINPGSHSPYVPSLLVPLYAIMTQEIEPEDILHVEADTFWLFEAILGEFSELEDEEGGSVWMRKLSEQLSWLDVDLSADLSAKGLDPSLPHYSYRWLAPLLTHTLPLSSVLPIWDTLFACPTRDKGTNPKVEHLLDVCAAMLIRARNVLFRLGKSGRRSPGLWADENQPLRPPSPIRAWEFGDAFLEGVSLLQHYPIEAAGGVDRILQTAVDISQRRLEASTAKVDNLSLGERIRVSMWKGFTNQVASPESPERSPEEWEESSADTDSGDDGNDTERAPNPAGSGFTSRIAANVWKGITNQTAMEVPPSPLTPVSPPSPPVSSQPIYHDETLSSAQQNPSLLSPSSIWKYAEKLKDSDTVATLSKVSSNWRAKSLLGGWNSKSTPSSPMMPIDSPTIVGLSSAPVIGFSSPILDERIRRGSLPTNGSTYSPPPRPAFFRPPRDSFLPQPRKGPLSSVPSSPEMPTHSNDGLMSRAQTLQASLAVLTGGNRSPQPAPKTGPRPLLLSSSTTTPRITRSATNTPDPGRDVRWQHFHRDSQSSISSLSPSDTLGRSLKFDGQAGWESDSFSKVVPLNRKSISPMARARMAGARRQDSVSSSANSSDRGVLSPSLSTKSPSVQSSGWGQVDSPPSSAAFSLGIPVSVAFPENNVKSKPAPLVLSDSDGAQQALSPISRQRATRKNSADYQTDDTVDTSDSPVMPTLPRSPRLKPKRAPGRPGNLRIQDPPAPQSNNLVVEVPSEQEFASTPRAMNFDVEGHKLPSPISPRSPRGVRKASADTIEARPRKTSTNGNDVRPRKISTESRSRKTSADSGHTPEVRPRKISTDSRTRKPSGRESAAEEGDDEGYDDLLSAYESEEGFKPSF
ncbi:hypothetical protein HGRIS_013178 [Hohenbuehelia grisea]|uniref:Rab-GAP TBC domain-containing protein n=1 Tax=Hohenbuehelia grisea TaxID=104357 RepID=A0ABR3IUX9_9AGAR